MCPNWCSNDMAVMGSPMEMDRLESFLAKSENPFDFNLFIPYPEKFAILDAQRAELEAQGVPWDKLPKDGYNSGGYKWCLANWGTKWNAVEVEKERTSDTTMSFWFDTANSAPDLVIKRMSELFPSLAFELNYEVEGDGYRHSLTYEAGEICDAREWEIEEGEEE